MIGLELFAKRSELGEEIFGRRMQRLFVCRRCREKLNGAVDARRADRHSPAMDAARLDAAAERAPRFVHPEALTDLQFTGPNRDAPNAGSRRTVKQRFGSGATASYAAGQTIAMSPSTNPHPTPCDWRSVAAYFPSRR
jgi:hypothetical protein